MLFVEVDKEEDRSENARHFSSDPVRLGIVDLGQHRSPLQFPILENRVVIDFHPLFVEWYVEILPRFSEGVMQDTDRLKQFVERSVRLQPVEVD